MSITRPVQAASSLNRTITDSVVAALVRGMVPEAMFAAEFAIAITLVKSDTPMARWIIEPRTRSEVPPALRSAAWASVGRLEAAFGNWNRPWQADRSPKLVHGLQRAAVRGGIPEFGPGATEGGAALIRFAVEITAAPAKAPRHNSYIASELPRLRRLRSLPTLARG